MQHNILHVINTQVDDARNFKHKMRRVLGTDEM